MFPNMVLHFDVARQKSILALNRAMQGNQKIFLVTQKTAGWKTRRRKIYTPWVLWQR